MTDNDQQIPDGWQTLDMPELLLITTSFNLPVIVNEVLAALGLILKVSNSTLIRAGILLLLQNVIVKEDSNQIIAPPFMKELIRQGSNPNTSHPLNLAELVIALFPDNDGKTGDPDNA